MLRIGVHEQATKSNESGNMQELSTIMTDVYSLSSDKFEHDLLHLIGMCIAVFRNIPCGLFLTDFIIQF